jgi:hypothetical protein
VLVFAKFGDRELYAKGSLWAGPRSVGLGVRRVILTERSEVESESRRQPAVCIVQSTADARHEPPSLLSYSVKVMGQAKAWREDGERPGGR